LLKPYERGLLKGGTTIWVVWQIGFPNFPNFGFSHLGRRVNFQLGPKAGGVNKRFSKREGLKEEGFANEIFPGGGIGPTRGGLFRKNFGDFPFSRFWFPQKSFSLILKKCPFLKGGTSQGVAYTRSSFGALWGFYEG